MSSLKAQANNEEKERYPWENFENWVHCICVINFDLELGQAVEVICPQHVTLTNQEISNICYLAFPDSNSGCLGDTTFIVRLPNSPGKNTSQSDLLQYNLQCVPVLQIHLSYYWGYVYFRQVKDSSLPRGYLQKSVVILTRLPFNNLFMKICSVLAPEYFEHGKLSLEAACTNIEQWPPPTPGETLNLPLLGLVFQIYIPHFNNNLHNRQFPIVTDSTGNHVQTSIDDLQYFEILQPVLPHVHMLWELMLNTEPMIVMATSPTHCSSMVLALVRIISPLKYCGDFRPYFTIHDSEFKQFTSKLEAPPNVILGVTNPFFSKILHHWPHTIKLGNELGANQKFKLKKSDNTRIVDNTPGIYTSYKPFLQKDKHIIKKLLSGLTRRPCEAQSALLKRHFLELTQSFMIPLERYIASLMPLQKNISPFKAAPTPLPFNPDDFIATLETAGPQLTIGIKGDWIGLYRKFFRSPNFNAWFNMRYTELALKLQALHLETISNANLKDWVQGKPEVEVVDMVLKIRDKIIKCRDLNIPVNEKVKEKLNQRLQDVISSLPDDLKNAFLTT